jgi:flagellar motor protein MotB
MIRRSSLARSRFAVLATVPAVALSACVSQSAYDELQMQNQRLQAEVQQLQGQIATLQAQASFVEAGDLLFPSGGYELSAAGKTELANDVAPRLKGLPYAKVVVYGYTDNAPVAPELQRAGINDNLTLSTRRAGAVVTFLISQGIDPKITSAKGFGDTHPVAPNDTPANRAKNRRIVITVQGPGAPGA